MAFELKLFNGFTDDIGHTQCISFSFCANEMNFFFSMQNVVINLTKTIRVSTDHFFNLVLWFPWRLVLFTPKKCYVSASSTSTFHQLNANHAIAVLNTTQHTLKIAARACTKTNNMPIVWWGYTMVCAQPLACACDRCECFSNTRAHVHRPRNLHALRSPPC